MEVAELVSVVALCLSVLAALAAWRLPKEHEESAPAIPLAAPAAGHAPIVLQRLCGHAAGLLGVGEAAVLLRDRALEGQFVTVAAAGPAVDSIGSRSAAARGLAGLAMAAGHPLVADCDRLRARLDAVGASAAAPIRVRGEVSGALSVSVGEAPLRLGVDELELLGEVAALIGGALEHRQSASGARAAAEAQLSAALERADSETFDHSDHVARLARLVGRRLELSEAELFELELGARLHDIGKTRVPARILRKPGPLTGPERALMRKHCAWGAEMVAAVPGLEAVALIVRFHHERFDGYGYPDRLAGERIPLASRIIAVCDAYGAMTAERPYRGAMAPTDALRELERCAGTQFDPRIANLVASGSLADDLDHEPLRTASVEFGVEDLLPRA